LKAMTMHLLYCAGGSGQSIDSVVCGAAAARRSSDFAARI
jgi:hypothetical protein